MVLFAIAANGEEIPVDISLNQVPHQDRAYTLVTVRDAHRRYAHEQELRRLGFHDALTGLYNRQYFDEELDRVSGGRDWPIMIVMADVDGLKQVNDEFGHEAGDELIVDASRAISDAVRASDVVARLGGDEFAAILPAAEDTSIESIRRRIEGFLRSPGAVGGPLRISVGCGVAQEGDNLRAVLRRADAQMYEVKAARRRS